MNALNVALILLTLTTLGLVAVIFNQKSRISQAKSETAQIVELSKDHASDIEKAARETAAALIAEAEEMRAKSAEEIRSEREELKEQRVGLDRREERLSAREDRMIADQNAFDQKTAKFEADRKELDTQLVAVRNERLVVHRQLMRVAGLTAQQAQAELMQIVEHETRLDAANLARNIEDHARKNAEKIAKTIIVTAIQRVSADQTFEAVVSTVDLPGDDIKGRIIGREGRNIRSFEQITGVNVMIDDTPGSVLLSCFDPVRREVARATLAELAADGRIHPARIEEVYERNTEKIKETCLRAAEDALTDVGISDLHEGLYPYLGALRFRTSYGQNVLSHLVECGKLAAVMASELGLNVETCKRAAFLHDIGKSVTHEVEGSHAALGADLAKKFGESPVVVHAIAAHHNEIPLETVEDVLTQAADSISGSRPGARRESMEAYIRRLERLEEIASQHEGVDRVFAMQAGREVRVMVEPQAMSDAEAQMLARQIAKEIEVELTYPGNIRVTVVRETRAVEVAH